MISLLLIAALATSGDTTTTTTNAKGQRVITHHRVVDTEPQWVSEPTREDYDREYPLIAKSEGLNGRAVVQCVAAEDGALADCEILSESPKGEGFGAATLKLMTHYRMAPTDAKGRPIKGFKARLTIVWALIG